MTDPLEDRLPGALRRHAGEDDTVAGLAEGARSRARRRARRRTTGIVVGAALAVVAVPVGIALTGSSPSVEPAPPPAASDGTPTPDGSEAPASDGTRVESWRDLTVSVPSSWGYGGGTDWCASGGRLADGPDVVRPSGLVASIGCTPQQGYGVSFVDASAISWARDSGDVWQYGWESPGQVKVYPEDAWLGLFRVDDHAIVVVTADEATTRTVLEFAAQVDERDPNGCAVREGEDAAAGDGERWSVCRYAGDGWLEQSERLLTLEQSQEALAAVEAAPRAAESVPCGEPVEPDQSGSVVLGSGADLGSVTVLFQRECASENGVYLSGTNRQLTEDVLFWALSPGWSGSADSGVPLPDPLRELGG